MIVTIAVATFNHSRLLQLCLHSLGIQVNVNPSLYEILIINNNSTDDTKSIVSAFLEDFPKINIRHILEPTIGLSSARNRAIKESMGKYIAFIDDDAIANESWLSEIIKAIKSDPKLVAFGGPVKAYAEKPPIWFPLETSGYDLGDHEKVLKTNTNEPIGANMVFRKDVLIDEGCFDPHYGVKGHVHAYGEDTIMFQKIIRKGLLVKYFPGIKVDHLINANKLGLLWRFKRIKRVNFTCVEMAENKVELDAFIKVTIENIGFFLKRTIYYLFRNPLKSLFLVMYSTVSITSLGIAVIKKGKF